MIYRIKRLSRFAGSLNFISIIGVIVALIPSLVHVTGILGERFIVGRNYTAYIYPRIDCDYAHLVTVDSRFAISFINSYIIDYAITFIAFLLVNIIFFTGHMQAWSGLKINRNIKPLFLMATSIVIFPFSYLSASYFSYPAVNNPNCSWFNPYRQIDYWSFLRETGALGLSFFCIIIFYYLFLISLDLKLRGPIYDR